MKIWNFILVIILILLLLLLHNGKRRGVLIVLEPVTGVSVIGQQSKYDICQLKPFDVLEVDDFIVDDGIYGFYLVRCSNNKKTYVYHDEKVKYKKLNFNVLSIF